MKRPSEAADDGQRLSRQPLTALRNGGSRRMNVNQILILGALIAGILLIMLSTSRRLRLRADRPKEALLPRRFSAADEAVLGDVRNVMLQLERMVREYSGQLDTRHEKLMRVIQMADQRIARLEQRVQPLDAANGTLVSPGRGANEPLDAQGSTGCRPSTQSPHPSAEIKKAGPEEADPAAALLRLRLALAAQDAI